MRTFLFLAGFLFTFSLLSAQSGAMTMKRLGRLLKQECAELEGRPGLWQADFQERSLIIITDEAANRIRIFTPVELEENVKEGQLRLMLMANFHTALDAKYGLYEGYVISVFMHPLRELTDDQLSDALRQVVQLADTFGTTYSSTDFIFGGDQPPAPSVPKPKRRITRS